MTVIDVDKNAEARTLTITARFDAPPARVWQVWEDPRQLERWWGPPTYPATVLHHDLTPGGEVTYLMTGPEGDKHHGWWKVSAVDAPRSLTFDDGFGDDASRPDPAFPVTSIRVTLETEGPAGTVMRIVSTYPTSEAFEQLLAMGMAEGMQEALGQIPALLAS